MRKSPLPKVKQKKPLPFLHVQTKLVYANATVKSCTMEKKNNDLTEIIAQALNEMKSDLGDKFDPENINLLDDAIRNAEYLDELNKGKLPSSSAPGTKVYLLVEMLREYL